MFFNIIIIEDECCVCLQNESYKWVNQLTYIEGSYFIEYVYVFLHTFI